MEKTILRPIKYAESTDEKLLIDLEHFANTESFVDEEEYNYFYKKFCNNIRRNLGITNVVGFAWLNSEVETVHVLIYDIEATEDNFYTQKFDENNLPYIELQ